MTGPTQVLLWCVFIFVYGTVTLCGDPFQNLPLTTHNPILESYNPARETLTVWAIPISLAATDGIDFSFSSSGYLDVSVHQVVITCLCIQQATVGYPGIITCLSTPPGFSQTSTPFSLSTPRHPPCALNRLAIEIPNSITAHSPSQSPENKPQRSDGSR